MTQRVNSLFAAAFLLASIGCAARTPRTKVQLPLKAPGRYVESMSAGGLTRGYILRVPNAYDATKPLPLVIVLHGWTANAAVADTMYHMDVASQKDGFVMVSPQGLGSPQGWNAGFIDLSGKKADDVQFINALMDKVESEVGIDPDRVYVAGHSNGAFMAHYLAARLSGRIAAIAAVAGTVGIPSKDGGLKQIPDPSEPVSVLLIHGKADPMVSYEPSKPALLHGVGALDSARFWAKRDACNLTPIETVSDNKNVITDLFTGGNKGTEVELISIVNGVHDWPGGLNRTGVHESITGVEAADLIWAFFATHPKQR